MNNTSIFDFLYESNYNSGIIITPLPIILICIIVYIINEYKIYRILNPKTNRHKKTIFERIFKEKPIKHNLLHIIETDKAIYRIYDISFKKRDTRVNVGIERTSIWILGYITYERNSKWILEDKIYEESWGTLCSDSFDTFVHRCIYQLYKYIEKRKEIINEDYKI